MSLSWLFSKNPKLLRNRVQQALFLEGADSLGAELHLDFAAVDDDGLLLQVGLPDLFGMALRKADIAAVLFAFAGEITFLHKVLL